jgi:two-component system response regulator RstA
MNKIVYVEDEPEVGQLIAAYLGKHDMDVIVEPRGDRAEEVVVRENRTWCCWISCCLAKTA